MVLPFLSDKIGRLGKGRIEGSVAAFCEESGQKLSPASDPAKKSELAARGQLGFRGRESFKTA
jgi:hypothetical protein